MNVHIVRLDPYDPNLGLLVPIVAKRIIAFAKEYMGEMNPVLVTRAVMVPLWSQDPFTLLLALVSPEGLVVGHAVATVNTDGANYWVTVSQTQADGAVGDAVKRCIEYAEQWVENEVNPVLLIQGRMPVKRMVMITSRNEKVWERAYGFKMDRRIMSRPIGSLGHAEARQHGEPEHWPSAEESTLPQTGEEGPTTE